MADLPGEVTELFCRSFGIVPYVYNLSLCTSALDMTLLFTVFYVLSPLPITLHYNPVGVVFSTLAFWLLHAQIFMLNLI
jgi:hypothetical protein